jgi:hypothetical protein
MATVDKNFKVKHGLIVEGTTATVNGEDILTTGSTISTTDLTEGTNLFFTEQRAVDAVTDEINTAVEGAINALDTDDIEEGTTNLYFTNERAQDAVGNAVGTGLSYNDTTGAISVTANTYDAYGSASDVAGDLADHITDTSTHGVTGNIVGTTDTQDLSNKRIVDTLFFTDGVTINDEGQIAVIAETHELEVKANAGDLNLKTVAGNSDVNITATGGTINLSPAAGSSAYVSGSKILTADNTADVSGKTVIGKLRIDDAPASFPDVSRNYIETNSSDDLEVYAHNDITLRSNSSDIILDADGAAYLGSATSGQEIATQGYVNGQGFITSADLSGLATEQFVGDAIADVVGLAPAALDTLQELAAAFNDEPDTLQNLITEVGGKQDTLLAGPGVIIGGTGGNSIYANVDDSTISATGGTGLDALKVNYGTGLTVNTNGLIVDNTVIAEKSYVDTNFVSTADLPGQLDDYVLLTEKGANDGVATLDGTGNVPAEQLGNVPSLSLGAGETNLDVTDGELTLTATPEFTSVEINSLAKQVAATSSSLGSVPVTAYEFAKATYKTAKFLVKIDNGTENEVSEILLTLDSSDNIAITEYAIVGTNGSRGAITADINGSNVRLRVNPVNDSTINVVGTLLA